ncbi:acyl-CoA dehydrogenase family protein [Streptomyces sp. NPDC001941]|uniref:acyl-CoA dehydrogenase family protein n=1 Tax=Streptomyces sp. NPDC001941 TaxID=3154659 RepID=UPI00332B8511
MVLAQPELRTNPEAATGPGADPLAHARELAGRLAWPTTADRDRARGWDPALFARLARAKPGPGLAGPLVPEALGGGGRTAAEGLALLEGLAEGSRDPGLALAVAVHAVLATVPVRAHGTPRQRERYLPRMASGEWFGAVSLRQTHGGSVAPAVTARPATGACGGWLLTGRLDLVAGAPVAHHFLVVAAHEGGGRTAFLVDRATPGLLVTEDGPAAMHTCPWGRLQLDGAHVADHAVLGTVEGAATEVEPLLAVLDWVYCGAPWLGVMRALARDAVRAARERELFGRPLAHDQATRFALADLATQVELAEGLLRQTAARLDDGGALPLQEAAAARLFVAGAARRVTRAAADLTGPLADTGDGLAERAHRDALFLSRTGGGAQVLRPVVAASLLGLG